MQYANFKSLLYSDTLVPDVFISEYMPALKSEYVKIYVYCLFLAGKNKTPSVPELAHILDLPAETVKSGLVFMGNLELLSWGNDGVVLADLKEKEINRHYRPKSTSLPEEAAAGSRRSARRRQLVQAINDTFFSGIMAPSWYTDIDAWFDRYGFDEDVMMLLFRHCCDNNGLSKPYIVKVAESWHGRGIRNSSEVDAYMREYAATKGAARQIQKKLKLRKPLDEYQEALVDKWVNRLGFTMEAIELALKRSVYATNAGMAYYDAILADWHGRGLDTAEKIGAAMAAGAAGHAGETAGAGGGAGRAARGARAPAARAGAKRGGKARDYSQADYDQRDYDDGIYDQFVSYGFGGGKAGAAGGGAGDGADGGKDDGATGGDGNGKDGRADDAAQGCGGQDGARNERA
ncbi:MAG: DnaD domain protein [Clostridiales bacterium]|jgi:DnaD/phage-associated family protein|nr:DnaD domain protein [Clostridiales bacterium]